MVFSRSDSLSRRLQNRPHPILLEVIVPKSNELAKREVASWVQCYLSEQPMDCQQLRDTGYASLTSSPALAEPDRGILLVEDEHLVREVAVEVLKSAGYGVWKAACAVEALQLFGQHSKDIKLLITDVVLPDDRGPELAEKLRDAGGWFQTILISGYPERMIAKGVHAPSTFFYLAKPFSAETLTRKVRQVLSQQELPASSH